MDLNLQSKAKNTGTAACKGDDDNDTMPQLLTSASNYSFCRSLHVCSITELLDDELFGYCAQQS